MNEDLSLKQLVQKICLKFKWNPEDKRCFTLYLQDETPLLEKDSSEDLSKISVTELLDIQDMSKKAVILLEQDNQGLRTEKTIINFIGDYHPKIIYGTRGFFYMKDKTVNTVDRVEIALNKKPFGTVSAY